MSSASNWVGDSLCAWDDSKVKTDLDLLAFLSVGSDEESIIVTEFHMSTIWHLLLQEGVIVLLGQVDWLLSEADVIEEGFEIECPLTDVVVLLEQIEIPGLDDEQIV